MPRLILGLSLLSALLSSGCYSFKGISIDYSQVSTYFVERFASNAVNAEPTIAIRLTEDLKEKIRTESRLTLQEIDPDISFEGAVVRYEVTSEAPQPGEVTSINRLTIVTAVQYINNVNEEKSWPNKKNFSFFFDFPSTQTLADVEEEAISAISQQMMEDIFNAAFTDW
ncbi:LPS assembly lipoprotein LptE [Phaeodactylibacter luteus]|uniref:LptE family protein n=1 Tax=Phaeodactylibacter luteus TaxID=1564516 RepID=A0A5C6RMA6_9BACT|nr:LPS assembly lipoprotein LptE [Phaeodactylibacter luteus]TXB63476.1 hypothetical protein FRY97_08955 [Phaeodactylibacter luteus]